MWVTILLLVMGLALRARGFLFLKISFWEDEAAWAMRLLEWPLKNQTIRPMGFMAISKLLAKLLSPSETVLRALPWVAGVASLAMSPFLAKRLFTSMGARLLFVAAIALHPGAIDLSKEFKPYSCGLALHMAFLLLTLRYLDQRRRLDLGLLLGLLSVSTLFSQDTLFAYPGVFGVLLLDAWRRRELTRLVAIGSSAVAVLALLGTLYVLVWSHTVQTGDGTEEYWGNKYDVFFVKGDGQGHSRAVWTLERLGDIVGMPGMRRETWQGRVLGDQVVSGLRNIDMSVWRTVALCGAALLLYRRRGRDAVLLLGPLVVLTVFNFLGYWPLGAFRTNLFVVVYACGLAAAAFDRDRDKVDGWDLFPAGVLVIIPFLALGYTTHGHKVSSMAGDSAFVPALQALLAADHAADGQKAQLALDNASCAPWRYYTRYNPDPALVEQLDQRFDAHCTKNLNGIVHVLHKGLKQPGARAFVLLSRGRTMADVDERLPTDLTIEKQTLLGRHTQLVVTVKKRD